MKARQSGPKWTPLSLVLLLWLRDEGWSNAELAAHFDCTKQTVVKKLGRAGR